MYYDEIDGFTKGVNLEGFNKDLKTLRAVTNNILQIGELSKKLDTWFKNKHSKNIDWEELRETRNLIAHEYDAVSNKRLWDTATYDLRRASSVLKILHYELNLEVNACTTVKQKGNAYSELDCGSRRTGTKKMPRNNSHFDDYGKPIRSNRSQDMRRYC